MRAVPGGVVVAVHVQPRAGSTRLAGRHGDALKIRVSAPPVDGRATEAARVALADAVDVPPAAVRLIEGERSRLKRFRVDCDDPDAMLARIARLVSPADGA